MALNNIANEPRRELTEQGIGVVATILLGILDYKFSVIAEHIGGGSGPPWGVWMIIIPIGFAAALFLSIFFLAGLWYLAHAVGEGVCAMLAAAGLEVRPKLRDHEKRFWKYPGTILHGRQCDYGRKCAVK